MKKVLTIIGIVLVALLLIGLILALIFWVMFAGAGALYSNPPKPEITYGEFLIIVTYEVHGEKRIIEDTIICEFDGFQTLGEAGKYRKWKAYLKSGNERLTLLKIDKTSELYCSYGLPEYYMGDLRNQTREEYEQLRQRNFSSYFITFGKMENGKLKSSAVSTDEAWRKYNLKIIDRKYAPPVLNSFK